MISYASELFSPDFRENPYPCYASLRRQASVCRVPQFGAWAVSRYTDVTFVLKNPDLFSSTIMAGADALLLGSDPPAHTRNRRIVGLAFTPQRIALLEARLRDVAEQLIARILNCGIAFDLVSDFSDPLPVIAIAEMLGIDPEHHDDFKRWSHAVVTAVTGNPDPQQREANMASIEEFRKFFTHVISLRRAEPGDDLISLLTRAKGQEEKLSEEEVLGLSMLLLIGGSETTSHLIGNAMLALLHNPEALTAAREDPTRIPLLIEETLRYDSPVQIVYRRAVQQVTLAGADIPSGATVMALIGSANRDGKQFADPDRFVPAREPQGHIAFGTGAHFCLGASLARLEARVALETLFARFRRFDAPDHPVTRINSLQMRGPRQLRLQYEA